MSKYTNCNHLDVPDHLTALPVMFWLYGGGFIMGDASEENYLPGPLLDTKQVCFLKEIGKNHVEKLI